MSATKIFNDIKKSAKITKVRIARDRGEDTDEVRKLCKAHLHAMVNYFNGLSIKGKHAYKFADVFARVQQVPKLLNRISMFQDSYEEVLKWNALIHAKKLDMNTTIRHREVDSAMFSEICKDARQVDNKLSDDLAKFLYHYTHRNDGK